MAFKLIKGTFQLDVGMPDGDSVRFLADNDLFFDGIKGPPVEFKSGGTVQLRYEGIDSLEKAAIQPLAGDARDKNFELLRENGDKFANDPRGFILTYSTDQNRRPVAFAFSGNIDEADGSDIFLDGTLVRRSINYKLVATGCAYTMFYQTLFAEIRAALIEAYTLAKNDKLGIHRTDATTSGFDFLDRDSLAVIPPIFPKLWRRLEEFSRRNRDISEFKSFLQTKVKDKLHTTVDNRHFISFDNVVEVSGNRIKLLYEPTEMVFVP